jgi:Integrase zinc binding domain/Integrase core domain
VKAVQGLCPEATGRYSVGRFRLNKGVLFRENDGSGRRFQLVVPTAMRPEILRKMHQDLVAGHLGINKTLARVQERYWWPGLGRDVGDFVASCFSCQKLKPGPVPPVGQLQPLPPPKRPFEFVSMDHMGPLARTGRGNQHVLVAIDHLTKWVEIEAVSDTTANRTVEFLLNRICLRHGFPRVVLSDRGTAFTARVFEEFCEEWGIQHRMSAPEHPQTNGLVERMNKTIGPILASYVNKSHTNWDELVPFAAFAINTAVQETTGFAPFELVCGRTAVFPHEWSFPWPGETPFRYRRFNRNVGRLRRAARKRARKVMERRRARFDSRHKPARNLFPGDLVLVRRKPRSQGLSKKFLPKFIGPYQVRRRLGPVTYLVEDVPARRRKRLWRSFPAHVSQIREFRVPHMAVSRNRPTRETVRIPETPTEDEAHGDAPQGDAEGCESDLIRTPPRELPADAGALDRPRRDRKVPGHLRDFELGDPYE